MTNPGNVEISIGKKNYEIQKTLGKGVFGEVLLAKDTASNDLVAIKKFAFNKQAFEAPLREGLENYLNALKNKVSDLQNNPSPENQAELGKLQTNLASIENDKEAFITKKLEAYYSSKQDEYNKIINDISKGAAHEHKILKLVGDSIGPMEANDNTQTYFLAMKLAKGDTLSKVLGVETNTPNPLSEIQLANISTQFIDKLLSLQEKSIVLRDLHTNNVMYDTKTGELSIIDYGDALELKNGVAKAQAMGSDPYIAPEVIMQADARHEAIQDASYSEKTTIFTAGAMIAKLFDLADTIKTRNIKIPGDPPEMFRTIKLRNPETQKSKISDPEIREQLLDLLNKMTEKNPDKREITLPEVKSQIDNIMGNYLQKHNQEDIKDIHEDKLNHQNADQVKLGSSAPERSFQAEEPGEQSSINLRK